MQRVTVVKVGGSTLGGHDTTTEDLVLLQQKKVSVVVVHGGGQYISDWFTKMGMPNRFVDGLRVTDAEGLRIAAAVLAGLVNKELVLTIQGLGGRTIGLSGTDGNLLRARVKSRELGFVGEIVKVDATLLNILVREGFMPVVAPICSGTVDSHVTLLNVNADAVAGEIATATGADKLVFLTDVDGIQDDSGKTIPRLTAAEARSLLSSGTASGGMLPKVAACLRALTHVNETRIINGRVPHALLSEYANGVGGTTIVPN